MSSSKGNDCTSDARAENGGYETYHFYAYVDMGMGSAILALSVNEIENGAAVREGSRSVHHGFSSYHHGSQCDNVPSLNLYEYLVAFAIDDDSGESP